MGAVTEQADFPTFFRLEYRRLVALGAAIIGSVHIAEELAQEAMWRAHERWSVVSGYDDPGAWTRRVLVNLAIDGWWTRHEPPPKQGLCIT